MERGYLRLRPESDTVKADTETQWTPVARRRRFRNKTPDPEVVEATKKLRSMDPTSDSGDNTKIDLTDAETRKWWTRQVQTMTSLQRNTGALRTSWPRLRWMS